MLSKIDGYCRHKKERGGLVQESGVGISTLPPFLASTADREETPAGIEKESAFPCRAIVSCDVRPPTMQGKESQESQAEQGGIFFLKILF